MKKRGRPTKKPSAADFLASPPEAAPPAKTNNRRRSPPDSPKLFDFDMNSPVATAKGGGAGGGGGGGGSSRKKEKVSLSPLRKAESVSSISELKELVGSRLEAVRRMAERSHGDIVKEVDSFNSRLHKRFKIQTQACQQLMDETDKEFKKMSERITESCEAMKASYAEFAVEGQTSLSRVCKTSIPEKALSFEKALDALRNRYVM